MIEVQHLRKRFGTVTAVEDLSFVAADGAITGIVGENGAGKTTTLGMVTGLLTPDAGTIHIDGVAASDGDARRHLGALLDHQGLYPRLTARENILYFGELQGIRRPELTTRVNEIVSILGLDRIADRRTAGFSQGERVKVALARAIAHNPQNLLLDEVTNGLDVPTVRNLRELLRTLRGKGRCILFSSHVLEEVRALSDHIVVIVRGRVIAAGTADAICRDTEAVTLEQAFMTLNAAKESSPCLAV